MALSIKVVGNNSYQMGDVKGYVIALGLFDGDNPVNGIFKQSVTMTNALAGVTDYGCMVFNDMNSTMSASVEVAAVAEDGTTVSVSKTLTQIKNTTIGAVLS